MLLLGFIFIGGPWVGVDIECFMKLSNSSNKAKGKRKDENHLINHDHSVIELREVVTIPGQKTAKMEKLKGDRSNPRHSCF